MTFGTTSAVDVVDVPVSEDQRATVVPRVPLVSRVAVWVPAVLVLCLGFLGLDRHSVWRDEAASLVAARRGLPELWAMLRQIETVHAVYYTFLHAWLQLGDGEVWARVPSVLAMAAAAGLVGIIGSRLVSMPVGLVAGLLFAVNPSVSYYAQEARSTALVAAFALLATWFLLQALERRSAWWAAYALACTLLVGLNLLALLVPLAHLITLLLWRHRRRVLIAWAAASAPALLVAVVLMAASNQRSLQIGWIPAPGIASIRDFAHLALGPNLPAIVLMVLLVLLGIVGWRLESERRLLALALPLAVLPSAALLALSLVQPIFVSRYVFPSVAAVALLAVLGVLRLGRLASRTGIRAIAPVAVLAVVVVAAAGVGAQRLDRTPASRPDDLAGAARVVAAGARPGDAMLFLPSNRRIVALVYPGQFRELHDVGLGDGPVAADNLTGRSLSVPETLQNLATSQRVWAIGRPGLEVLPSEAGARAELAMLDRDFVAVDRTGARGVGITLYVRRPAAS